MIIDEIREKLIANQDIKYRDFQSKLIPNVNPDTVIGVRTPILRKMAKELIKKYGMPSKELIKKYGLPSEEHIKECDLPSERDSGRGLASFLSVLPHKYFEENQLHAFILSEIKDFNLAIEFVERFLPYVDNWATCDQMSIKIFKKHRQELLPYLMKWIKANENGNHNSSIYTTRFGIVTLMNCFLDDDFKPEYLKWIEEISSEEYYINMARAWFFATALAKQYEATLPFLESHKLDKWTHNKSIQKAIESYRVSKDHKDYLKTLRI